MTYEEIIKRAAESAEFRDGLLAAACVARANDSRTDIPACPATMAAVYIERLADGELP